MYPLFKRLADIVVSIMVLTCFSPILLILAILLIAVYKESPVFVQERPGLHGKPFRLYKLKSMRSHSEADGSAETDEQRVTRIGAVLRRLKLDELPQFWNVLKGDMSLVGPRPLLMEYLPLYSVDQMKRHDVQPGITGWAQIHGASGLAWTERFEKDVWYVENRGLGIDLKILFMTCLWFVAAGWKKSGAADQVEAFRGNP